MPTFSYVCPRWRESLFLDLLRASHRQRRLRLPFRSLCRVFACLCFLLLPELFDQEVELAIPTQQSVPQPSTKEEAKLGHSSNTKLLCSWQPRPTRCASMRIFQSPNLGPSFPLGPAQAFVASLSLASAHSKPAKWRMRCMQRVP